MSPRVAERQLEVEGRELTVRDLDRVIFPADATTRQDLLTYYEGVADVMLPHLSERPLRMPRYPAGVEGPCWTRACPRLRPDWLATTTVWSPERGEPVEYCVVNERAALLWTVGMGSIELFTTLHHRQTPHRPTAMAFDLEPGEGVTLLDCCVTALGLRDLLAEDGLSAYVKTSGCKGLHVVVPLNLEEISYADTRPWARALADRLERRRPQEVVAGPDEPFHRHKVLADYRVNTEHGFMIAPYSVRAEQTPSVSTPVTWDEVGDALQGDDPHALSFDIDAVLERVRAQGDLFAGVLGDRQALPAVPQTA